MIILTIISFTCLVFVIWATVNFISEKENRHFHILPLLVVLITHILSHLNLIRFHNESDKEKVKAQYEQVTETFYRKIK